MNTTAATARRWRSGLLLVLLASGVIVAGVTGSDLPGLLAASTVHITGLGATGQLLFVAAYVAATVLLVPASALTLGAGALFGLAHGVALVSVASTLGATSAFLIGRYLARDAVARRVAADPRFAAIDRAVASEGWKIVGLMRLSPAFPFGLLNYGLGLTRVPLAHYALASWVGMLPGTFAYVYLGSVASTALRGGGTSAVQWLVYGVGLAATIAVTVMVTRIARRALGSRLGT